MPRTPQFPVEAMFPARWSPRAMSGEPVSHEAMMRLFEAARWAPSSNNNQPWRFVYARAGTPAFETLYGLLSAGNLPWCARAGALVVVVAKTTFDSGAESITHSFDTGAAWMNLALQGSAMGLVTHGMQGFDYAAARGALGIPAGYAVQAMIAVGHPGSIDDLPERYRAREVPNDRHPVGSFAFEGAYPESASR